MRTSLQFAGNRRLVDRFVREVKLDGARVVARSAFEAPHEDLDAFGVDADELLSIAEVMGDPELLEERLNDVLPELVRDHVVIVDLTTRHAQVRCLTRAGLGAVVVKHGHSPVGRRLMAVEAAAALATRPHVRVEAL